MTLRRRPMTLAATCVLGLALAAPVHGQTPAKKSAAQPERKAAPVNLALIEVRRGIQAAEKELAELKASVAASAETHGASIAEETKKTAALREEERLKHARLRDLDAEIEKTEQKLQQTTDLRGRAQEALDVTRDEIKTQAGGLKDRFRSTLAAYDDDRFIEVAVDLEKDSSEELPLRLATLLDLYGRALDLARTVGVLQAPVQLAQQGGKIEKVDVLRLGLMGGYYSHAAGGDSGFVSTDPGETRGGLKGDSLGLTAEQKAQIAMLVKDPAAGGFLPSDISGGQGVAALRSKDSFSRWFELGGFCMWPLLCIAIAAVLLVIERAITLTVKSLGIQRKIERVLALIRQGQLEAAEEYCAKLGGAVGGVLHAALVHRSQGRSVMEDAVQEALLHHAPTFQARLSFIALCAAVAPLFGLLGTVTGMITTFKMVTLFGTSDPRFMAGGISEALVTTEAGLWIAIPSLLLRGLLGSLADAGLGRLETGALSVVIALSRATEEAQVPVGDAA